MTTDIKIKEEPKNKLEDDYDDKLAEDAYKSVDLNDTTTLSDLCAEAGIDYEAL